MPVLSESAQFRSQIQGGNLKGAAEFLLEKHGAESLAVCRAMVGDADAARDLFHDAFMRACDGLTGYRGEATPKTWFLRITHNRCVDHLRREKRRPWVLAADMGPNPEVDDSEPDWTDEGYSPFERSAVESLILDSMGLERAIAALDERDRSLVILRYGHEMSFAELGESFGVKPGAMRMRVQRALARLRELMEIGVDDFATSIEHDAPPMARPLMAPQASLGDRRYEESAEILPLSALDPLDPFIEHMRRFRTPLQKAEIRMLVGNVQIPDF